MRAQELGITRFAIHQIRGIYAQARDLIFIRMCTRIKMEPVNKNLSLQNVNIKSCFVLSHQNENRFSKLLFNSDDNKCFQSYVELFINEIMSLLFDIMTLIEDNLNIAIIMKTIKLKNITKLWCQKIRGLTKFILVLIAELINIYQPNEQNHSTSTLC